MKSNLSIITEGTRQIYSKNRVSIPSRFFLAPINTGLAFDGFIGERFVEFYNKRSGHGLGVTYIGNVSIGREWKTNRNTPVLSSDNIDDWKKLASVIVKNGSVPGIQLACRTSIQKPMREWKREDSEIYVSHARAEFSAIPTETIDNIFQSFLDTAHQSIEAGFKIIQIHAAHGYFFSQLLDSRINCRKDAYGTEPLAAIHSLISSIISIDKQVLIDIRLSLTEGFNNRNLEYDCKATLIGYLIDTGVDMISLSNGTYDLDKTYIYPPKSWGHGPYIECASSFAIKYPRLIWNVAGNIWDIRNLPQNAPENLTYSLGRSLIADPEIIQKSLSGDFKAIRQCIRKGDCHYYSKGTQHICCPLEPSLGGEFSECLYNL